jgi:hypothetical protein
VFENKCRRQQPSGRDEITWCHSTWCSDPDRTYSGKQGATTGNRNRDDPKVRVHLASQLHLVDAGLLPSTCKDQPETAAHLENSWLLPRCIVAIRPRVCSRRMSRRFDLPQRDLHR